MRLIDADKLMTDFGDLIQANSKLIDEWLLWQIEDAINDAPTIKAISAEEHAEMVGKLCAKFVEEFEDYEPIRHGRWIKEKSVGDCCYKCSECGFIRDAYLLEIDNYCPECGAKMDEVEDAKIN